MSSKSRATRVVGPLCLTSFGVNKTTRCPNRQTGMNLTVYVGVIEAVCNIHNLKCVFNVLVIIIRDNCSAKLLVFLFWYASEGWKSLELDLLENFEAKLKYLSATLGLIGGTFITTKIARKMRKGAQAFHQVVSVSC